MADEYPLLFKKEDKEEIEKHRQEALIAAEKSAKVLKEKYGVSNSFWFSFRQKYISP